MEIYSLVPLKKEQLLKFMYNWLIKNLTRTNERNGLMDFLQILQEMEEFNCIEFNIGDIVRSGFVRNYLIQKTKLGMGIE